MRRLVSTAAARRDFAAARGYEKQLEADNPHMYIERTSLAIDQARWSDAQSMARKALALTDGKGIDSRYLELPIAVADWMAGDAESARGHARNAIDKALSALRQAPGSDSEEDAALALSAALVTQRIGGSDATGEVLEALKSHSELMEAPQLAELAAVARAGHARRAGRAYDAIEILRPFLTGRERYQTHVELMEAFASLGKNEDAIRHAQWLQAHRGLAYVELECGHCLQALNVADSNLAIRRAATLLQEQGKPAEAKRKFADFNRLWPTKGLPVYLRM